MRRLPAAAGQFYPAAESSLKDQISTLINTDAKKQKAISVISPHAGYMYSGKVAGAVFSRIHIPGKVIILGPNHSGRGPVFSIYSKGSWSTPLGDAAVDETFVSAICAKCSIIKQDNNAHMFEHSLEVQIPFLQFFKPDVQIIPIVISEATNEDCRSLAHAIAYAVKNSGQDCLIVASTDMTHYESRESAEKKDKSAIQDIINLDELQLIKDVRNLNITMCGYVPTVVAITASKELGATGSELIAYQTSGDVSGDYSSVVGYAGMVIT